MLLFWLNPDANASASANANANANAHANVGSSRLCNLGQYQEAGNITTCFAKLPSCGGILVQVVGASQCLIDTSQPSILVAARLEALSSFVRALLFLGRQLLL